MSEMEVTFEADLDAAPETVWRALSEPDLLAEWLGAEPAAACEPVDSDPGRSLTYRFSLDAPASLITFEIEPREGGAHLTITHAPASAEVIAFPAPLSAGWRMAA